MGTCMDLNKMIVKDLQSNDEAKIRYSFNCVYNKYYKLVCFCISQYIKSKEDIEEIANDTFLNFFNNLSKLDENKNIKYYLLVIAKNNAISFLRKNNKYVTLTDEALKFIPYEQTYESNEIIDKLKNVLSKEELYLIVEHLIIGSTFKEISTDINVSINTIMSKYQRAMKKAYKYLKEENIYE